ncbi:HDOD domain-containing protein [Chitinivorax sp. PXF-14]|uniref:HDOD domain-containing protein n=1 Tax=Chitinivorax sp. PXF-14 TaxID=3230488 RepID=UPI0034672138
MPQILLRLLELCQDDDADFAELAELIGHDAGCTAKVIAATNAAEHYGSKKISRLDQCLVMLGKDAVKTLIISESVFQVFNAFSGVASHDLRAFWCHTLATALLAKSLAHQCGYPHPEEAYLSGLLHDVGRLGLLSAIPEGYGDLFEQEDSDSLCVSELTKLDTTHAAVGGWLVDQWRLDSFIGDSVRYHHARSDALAPAHALIRITHVANRLAQVQGQRPMDMDAIAEAERIAQSLCGIDAQTCRQISSAARSEVGKVAEKFGIHIDGFADDDATSPPADDRHDDDATRRALTEAVRNIALCNLSGLRLNQAASTMPAQHHKHEHPDAALLAAFSHTLQILFGLQCPVVFLREARQDQLHGMPLAAGLSRLEQITLPITRDNGAAARALLDGGVIETARTAEPLAMIDEQLLRMLDADRLICVPLESGRHCLGTLVLTNAARGAPDVPGRDKLLLGLAAQAASALLARRAHHHAEQVRVQDMQAAFQLHARSVAHEANNPLAIIKNYLALLARKLADPAQSGLPDIGGELQIIRDEINRVGTILARLAEPSAMAESQQGAAFDMARLIEETATFCRDIALAGSEKQRPAISVLSRAADKLPAVAADRAQAKQVLLNLAKNALEALDGREGQITLEASGVINRDGELLLEVLVRDSGPGIARDVLARLFRPIQTSKGAGHQGLGLAIVKELMNDMQGAVSCRSSSLGTEFALLFPVVPTRQTVREP